MEFLLFLFILGHSYEHAKVFGNVYDLWYYYVDIYVGTPPVKQTVIVDTGSTITAFPCTGCIKCGSHIDPWFDPALSSSYKQLGCDECLQGSSCKDDKWFYSQHYTEGSSISGYIGQDIVYFGDDYEQAVEFTFGCHKHETKLFKTQKADGIMGLSYTDSNQVPTLIDELWKDHEIQTNLFAMWLADDNGLMTIGGYNTTHHLSSIQYAPLYSGKYYALNMHGFRIDSEPLVLTENDFGSQYHGSILDSGTTFTYLASHVYRAFWARFKSFCTRDGKWEGMETRVSGETHKWYKYIEERFSDKQEFYDTFPEVQVAFDDTWITWKPQDYLFAWKKHPRSMCVGVYSNGIGYSVLGANFMKGKDVIFDRSNNRVGFADADCDVVNRHGFRQLIEYTTQTGPRVPEIEERENN